MFVALQTANRAWRGWTGRQIARREPRHVGLSSKVSQEPWAHAVCTHGA